jgi:hypothetical protein
VFVEEESRCVKERATAGVTEESCVVRRAVAKFELPAHVSLFLEITMVDFVCLLRGGREFGDESGKAIKGRGRRDDGLVV